MTQLKYMQDTKFTYESLLDNSIPEVELTQNRNQDNQNNITQLQSESSLKLQDRLDNFLYLLQQNQIQDYNARLKIENLAFDLVKDYSNDLQKFQEIKKYLCKTDQMRKDYISNLFDGMWAYHQNKRSKAEEYFYQAFRFFQAYSVDPEAYEVQQQEIGISNGEKIGTSNLIQCVAVILYDPNTKRTIMAHVDECISPDDKSLEQAIMNTFDPAAKLNCIICGGIAGHTNQIQEMNLKKTIEYINRANKQRREEGQINITQKSINGKIGQAILFDPKDGTFANKLCGQKVDPSRQIIYLQNKMQVGFNLIESKQDIPKSFNNDNIESGLKFVANGRTKKDLFLNGQNISPGMHWPFKAYVNDLIKAKNNFMQQYIKYRIYYKSNQVYSTGYFLRVANILANTELANKQVDLKVINSTVKSVLETHEMVSETLKETAQIIQKLIIKEDKNSTLNNLLDAVWDVLRKNFDCMGNTKNNIFTTNLNAFSKAIGMIQSKQITNMLFKIQNYPKEAFDINYATKIIIECNNNQIQSPNDNQVIAASNQEIEKQTNLILDCFINVIEKYPDRFETEYKDLEKQLASNNIDIGILEVNINGKKLKLSDFFAKIKSSIDVINNIWSAESIEPSIDQTKFDDAVTTLDKILSLESERSNGNKTTSFNKLKKYIINEVTPTSIDEGLGPLSNELHSDEIINNRMQSFKQKFFPEQQNFMSNKMDAFLEQIKNINHSERLKKHLNNIKKYLALYDNHGKYYTPELGCVLSNFQIKLQNLLMTKSDPIKKQLEIFSENISQHFSEQIIKYRSTQIANELAKRAQISQSENNNNLKFKNILEIKEQIKM